MTSLSKTAIALACAGTFFGLSGPAAGQEAPGAIAKMESKRPASPGNFTDQAANAGMLEVELGQLATAKSSDSAVRQYAERMVDDHSKADDDLSGIGAKDNFMLPTQVTEADQPTIDRLSHLSGGAFDRAYMRQMVVEHEKEIALFQREAASGANQDVKTWAAGFLLTLQDQLREARQIENRLVGGSI